MTRLGLGFISMMGCVALVVGACGTDEGGDGGDGNGEALTYYKDIKPIIDTKCVNCHKDGGIGPFSLAAHADLVDASAVIPDAIISGQMPPWPPDNDCNDYKFDRSLAAEDIDTIVAWFDAGAEMGSPDVIPNEPPPVEDSSVGRIDLTLELDEAYTPIRSPDDYRCFVFEWPETETRYVTGFNIVPGDDSLVHHVIAFMAPASAKAEYDNLDAREEGPGYTCFGATNGTVSGSLGSWVPGAGGMRFPEGTGIRMEPGQLVILQVHYNTLFTGPRPDKTSLQVQLADTVAKPAYFIPWSNPFWLEGLNMKIPANDSDVLHSFSFDPTPFTSQLTQGRLPDDTEFDVHMVTHHMHLLGTRGYLQVSKQVGGDECLLDIPKWDFDWQGFYYLRDPVRINKGDRLTIDCRWDNSAANQPLIDGTPAIPQDVYWGEGSRDEMCLGGLYITPVP